MWTQALSWFVANDQPILASKALLKSSILSPHPPYIFWFKMLPLQDFGAKVLLLPNPSPHVNFLEHALIDSQTDLERYNSMWAHLLFCELFKCINVPIWYESGLWHLIIWHTISTPNSYESRKTIFIQSYPYRKSTKHHNTLLGKIYIYLKADT